MEPIFSISPCIKYTTILCGIFCEPIRSHDNKMTGQVYLFVTAVMYKTTMLCLPLPRPPWGFSFWQYRNFLDSIVSICISPTLWWLDIITPLKETDQHYTAGWLQGLAIESAIAMTKHWDGQQKRRLLVQHWFGGTFWFVCGLILSLLGHGGSENESEYNFREQMTCVLCWPVAHVLVCYCSFIRICKYIISLGLITSTTLTKRLTERRS